MSIDEIQRGRQRLEIDWQYTFKDKVVMRAKKAVNRVLHPTA